MPPAIKYLHRSRLPDGRLARFYELKTNKPLYLTRGADKVRVPRMSRALAARAKAVIDRLDEQGRWVERGKMRQDTQDDPVRRVIDCRTFVSNMRTLSAYLAAAR